MWSSDHPIWSKQISYSGLPQTGTTATGTLFCSRLGLGVGHLMIFTMIEALEDCADKVSHPLLGWVRRRVGQTSGGWDSLQ